MLRLGERGDVSKIDRTAAGALHPDEIVASGDRDRAIAERDQERALAQLGERHPLRSCSRPHRCPAQTTPAPAMLSGSL